MRTITATDLASIVDGQIRGDERARAGHVSVDSRESFLDETAFFALAGPRFDGSRFAQEALEKGATIVVVGSVSPDELDVLAGSVKESGSPAAIVIVEDTLRALQALASWARQLLTATVIGITGSNGKTTVKEMLREVLSRHFFVSASPMSWNSQVGVALSLLRVPQAAEFALIECGISKPGEMERLRAMVRPDLGVFVNVGLAHRETLRDEATTASEKAQLFTELPRNGWVCVPAEESAAVAALSHAIPVETTVVHPSLARYGVSLSGTTIAVGERAGDVEEHEVSATAALLEQDVRLAVDVAVRIGVPAEDAARAIAAWKPVEMRLERITTVDGLHIINDAYSADPESVSRAIVALGRESGEGRRIAVLGELAQLGTARASAHRHIGNLVARSDVDVLVTVGASAGEIVESAVAGGFPRVSVVELESRDEVSQWIDSFGEPGDMILLKGSRALGLDQAVDTLAAPLSPARLYIDLEAVAENLDALRDVVGPGVKLMPVVKSFGYGLDARKLADTYESSGADYLAVAYPDEGVSLRRHGIQIPIMVQNVMATELSKLLEYRLDAQVASFELVQMLAARAQMRGKRARVHLKIDTGMGRAGVEPGQAVEVASAIAGLESIDFVGLMTHLAAADEVGQDEFTRQQISCFAGVRDALAAIGIKPPLIHAANSAGSLRFPEAHFSMVRSGIGLLGYLDSEGVSNMPFRPVLRFVTRVVSVRELASDHPVGYGLSWRVPSGGRRIAVAAVGYNDGYPRHLSNVGWMSVRGTKCPVVGKVCMDVTMLDVTEVEGIQPGDEVVIYGTEPDEPGLCDMASRAGTISYELLTRLSPRVRRIYLQGQ